jgi:copper oxidase (laccase) domain-containing protein
MTDQTAEGGVERFAALGAIPALRHGFTLRAPGLDVRIDRDAALARLNESHQVARREIGVDAMPFIFGEQVHGARVAIVDAQSEVPVRGVDAVITRAAKVCLGVYVADCCAIYLVDPATRVIGLAHSGRKGTEANIAGAAVARMVDALGCRPERIVAQLSPCIRPPHYEVDFAAQIVAQLRASGIRAIHDANRCTACEPARYYSYRAERGLTGRMLALLAFDDVAK